MSSLPRRERHLDWILLGTVLALVALGLIVIWSISFKATTLGSSGDAVRQAISVGIGLMALVLLARSDYRLWRRLTPWLYGAMLVLLAGVLFFSHKVLGAQRWLQLGFFQFQPSELAKLALILGLARFLSKNYDRLEKPRYLAWSVVYLAAPAVLVALEPDLGTALVLGFTWLVMVLSSRISKAQVAVLALAGLAALPLVYRFLPGYQKDRITSYLNPQADPQGASHHVIQAKIAIGSGQIFGRGLAAGTQSQYGFLPKTEQPTDFIFSVLGEKLGFVGGVLLIILYAVLLWRGTVIAYRAADRFGFFLAVGIVAMIFCHVAVNISMNMGLVPVTGIPLPLVSYGGTALLIDLAAIGLLESITRHRTGRSE